MRCGRGRPCGFVRSKTNQRWLWWVEEAATGRVVAFVLGRRTYQTFRRLLTLLKQAKFSNLRWLTDYYWAYIDCLPAAERIAGKAPLQSLERKHLTLRTRLKRLTRRSICFSKSEQVHDTVVGLFINHYFFDFKIQI